MQATWTDPEHRLRWLLVLAVRRREVLDQIRWVRLAPPCCVALLVFGERPWISQVVEQTELEASWRWPSPSC